MLVSDKHLPPRPSKVREITAFRQRNIISFELRDITNRVCSSLGKHVETKGAIEKFQETHERTG